MRAAVIGAGSWGTAIAWLLGSKGYEVRLWARSEEVVSGIREGRRNPRYLTDTVLAPTVTAMGDLAEAVKGAHVVVVATPSSAMRETAHALAAVMDGLPAVVTVSKGLEPKTLKRMTEVLAEELRGRARLAALSGPNHAEEVVKSIPTATVVAAYSSEVGALLQDFFSSPSFRVYTNSDVLGVELSGASKNVIAVAAGMSDGLGYGDNTKATLITRGLAEMARLGLRFGANSLTYVGLAGMGDLIATCTSRHSRNRALGEMIARGGTMDEYYEQTHMVAEGAMSAVTVTDLAASKGVELPISRQVRRVLYEGVPASDAVEALMGRSKTDEMYGLEG